MKRGEIWWATLRPPRGSEPGYQRPVLIVQSDAHTRSRIGTAVVVVLTSNLRLAGAPGNVLLRSRTTRLPKDSVANVSQIATLDKSFFTERVSRLSATRMREVDDGLRLVLDLG